MSENMYDAIKPEKEVIKTKGGKVSKFNKDNLIIGIIVAVIILAVAGIMCYYFIFRDNEVIATYDNGEVTRGEYELYYKTFAPMLSYYGYSSDVISKYIAEKVILDEIVVAEAKSKDFTLTDEQKQEVDTLFEDEDNVNEFLNRDLDLEALKELFYNDSLISAYIEKMQEEATEEQVKEYILSTEGEEADLNIYNTRHILFQISSSMTDDEKAAVKKEANEVLARVNKGEDFATLAKEFSDDTYTEQYSEGKYEATTSSTAKAYIDAVKKLKAGSYTNYLVEDETYGYFIIKLDSISANGRLKSETEVGYYVDDILYSKQEAAKCEYNDDKINSIATTLGTSLGIITVEDETVEE